MGEVVEVARTMGPEQLFFALVYLSGYSLALGEFATARGRLIAAAAAFFAAAGFAVLSSSWAAGVVLVGFASVGVGLFSGASWAIWRAAEPAPVPVAPQDPAANLARTWATSSARSTNTVPILNSPAAE
jgi:hypothetical protein